MTVELIETHKSFEGWQNRYRHQSKVLNCTMEFSLYLPTQVAESSTPLVWWLTGLSGSDENFSTKSGFQSYASQHGLAVVIPDTSPRGEDVADDDNYDLGQGASYYINAKEEPWRKHYQMYDYITEELTEIVHDLVPNFNGSETIMGHSIGGYGAMMIGLKNPDRFKAISAFAPATNITQVPWGIKAFSHYLGEDKNDWKEWDPIYLLKQATALPKILITQGADDQFYQEQLLADKFLTLAEQKGFSVDYQLEEGHDHSYYTIATYIDQHLAFHKKNI